MVTRQTVVCCAVVLVAVLVLSLAAGCGPKTQASKSAPVQANAQAPATADASATGASDVVHTTATGQRYHRAGCRSLSKSDITMTRAEAEQRGLTPCKVCKP